MGSAARIEDYALLGDRHTAALVHRDGSVDWLCLPRFDSPACFAALLGGRRFGAWRLAPTAAGPARRRYRPGTLVLETEWDAAGGRVRVVDVMPPRDGPPVLVRLVEGLAGSVRMRSELLPRFDYGRITPWLRHEDGRWAAVAGPDALWFDTTPDVEAHDGGLVATFDVAAGETVGLVLAWTPSWEPAPPRVDARSAVDAATAYWTRWSAACTYDGRWSGQVRRSLLTLEALTYAPTGGIVAAATTSLPEQPGGPRNWDYRYCWLRDTTFTLRALVGAGYAGEARAWRDWLLRAVAGDPADLQIMYTITGRRRIPEETLDHLSGFAGSRPVRAGNAASGQFQLDVPGELLTGLDVARAAGLSPDDHAWELQAAVADHLESVWRTPDASLWEVRGEPRHYVHSKVRAWAGLDRMVRTARRTGLPGPVDRWEAARDAIHADVLAHGYDADRSTFVRSYGSKALDGALLLLPRTGFLPPDDPRMCGTVDAVRTELTRDGFVLRYRTDQEDDGSDGDGLPGGEGAFLACSFWLADALALQGRDDEATELFERLLGCTNDVGLLSEEWDTGQGRQLGNTPQAFSHVGLVHTALTLEGRRAAGPATLAAAEGER